jgi:ABC-2 type transport system permease protein
MNTQSNAMPESPPDSHPVAPAAMPAMSATRPLYWSVRRELWENRSIYIVPLAAAAVVLLGFLISTIHLQGRVREMSALDPARQHALLILPYGFAAILIILTTFIVGVFYCLDALHSERRDRSILFWKSLPVSDLTTVLSKASIPFVVLPLLAFAIIVATQLIMLLLSTLILLVSGTSAAILWTQLPMFLISPVLPYGLAVLALWHAPLYGWLLLVSAWAQRSTFLWAVLPPLAICVIEKLAFNTWHFAAMLKFRLTGSFAQAFAVNAQGSGIPLDPIPDPVKFLGSPGLWIGLVVAAGFLAAAVWLRRYREPI